MVSPWSRCARPSAPFTSVVLTALAVLAASAHATPLTLPEALARVAQHPSLARAGADVGIALAERRGADRTPYNPELGLAVGPELGGGDPGLAWQLSLAQTVELGGKRARRVGAAKGRIAAAETRLAWTQRLVTLDVRSAFQLALVARARRDAAQAAEGLATQRVELTTERLQKGAGDQLEVNVARADLGRARRERLEAESQYDAAKVDLARAVGAAPAEDLEPDGALPTFPPIAETEDAVAARAAETRPDVMAAQQDRLAAVADLAAARSLATPDLTLGVDYGRSGGVDTVLATASIPLFVWNANQGGIGSAQAAVTRASVEEDAARRDAERDARAAYRAYLKARDAVLGFEPAVVTTLADTLALSQKSFQAGKIGLVELNVLQRDLIEAQRSWLDALTDAVLARHALELSGALDLE
ncbi:MAG: TolC family protein [Myxococcota bacterium]